MKEKLAALKKQQEELAARIDKIFTTFMESQKDEDLAKYKNLLEANKTIAAEIAECEQAIAEAEALAQRKKEPAPAPIQEGRGKALSEEVKNFLTSFLESVSKGTTYNGLLPREVSDTVQMKKDQIAKLKGLCTIHRPKGDYTVYVEGDGATVEYVEEGAKLGETSPKVAALSLGALKLGALAKITTEYLEDMGFDVLNYITEMFAKALARKEDNEILFGTGKSETSQRVNGITNTSNVVTASAATTFTWAEVKKTIAMIKNYRPTAHIVISAEALDVIHGFKDGDKYIFPQNEAISRIMGVPVIISDSMPSLAAGKAAMFIGDFAYYHWCERQGVRMKTLNELYAETDSVGITLTERVDGDFVKEAFAALMMAAA